MYYTILHLPNSHMARTARSAALWWRREASAVSSSVRSGVVLRRTLDPLHAAGLAAQRLEPLLRSVCDKLTALDLKPNWQR